MAMAKDTMIWVVDDDPELRKMVGTYLIDPADFSTGRTELTIHRKHEPARRPRHDSRPRGH